MPRHVSRIHRAIIGLVVTLCAVVGGMPAARADEMTVVDFVAAHLHEQDRLYSPPGTNLLSKAEQARVDRRLFLTETPVYVAVLYPDAWQRYPGDVREIARKLQGNEGEGGTYLVIAGGRVSAYSAFDEIPAAGIAYELSQQYTEPTRTILAFEARVNSLSEKHELTVGGRDWQVWGAVLLVLLGVLAIGSPYLVARRRMHRQGRREWQRARAAVNEDITEFAEQLARADVASGSPDSDETSRAGYMAALNAYEQAKREFRAVTTLDDVETVTATLEEGRYRLACCDAHREGRQPPPRRVPCFFDPRHGPSVEEADWTGPDRVQRSIPVCAADATRIADGQGPRIRTVRVEGREVPYWEAGPEYGSWARGYFSSSFGAGATELLDRFMERHFPDPWDDETRSRQQESIRDDRLQDRWPR